MKKLFTLFAAMACFLSATATDYSDMLRVQINGADAATQKATIVIEKQANGKLALSLRNFILEMGETQLAVGNVNVKDVDASTTETDTVMHSLQTIKLEAGDDPETGWVGPMLPAVDVDVNALIKDGRLNAVIAIDATETLNMIIKVYFGSASYQLPNAGFESFHEAKLYPTKKGENGLEWDYSAEPKATSQEPDYWHSFMSASGYGKNGVNQLGIAYLAGLSPHTFVSNDVRPGSVGKSSLLLKSTSIMGIIANGTVTTGRINAGSANVKVDAQGDWLNHSWNDMSQTEVGQDGHPFYALMDGCPDSMAVWVKFKQNDIKKAEGHPYASIKAVINDGTYYQDPEEKGSHYTNVLAKAEGNTIADTNGEWVRVAVPFDYETFKANNATGRVALVTASTNADAGKGSDGDEFYLDDIAMIYNDKLLSVKFKGNAVEGFDKDKKDYSVTVKGALDINDIDVVADGHGAHVIKLVENELDQDNRLVKALVKVIVVAGNMESSTTYKFNVTYDVTSVSGITGSADDSIVAVYDLQGRSVKPSASGTYIVKFKSGKVIKVVRK